MRRESLGDYQIRGAPNQKALEPSGGTYNHAGVIRPRRGIRQSGRANANTRGPQPRVNEHGCFNSGLTASVRQGSLSGTNNNRLPSSLIQALGQIERAELNSAHRGGRFNEDYGFGSFGLHLRTVIVDQVEPDSADKEAIADSVPVPALPTPRAWPARENRK